MIEPGIAFADDDILVAGIDFAQNISAREETQIELELLRQRRLKLVFSK
jgi:hypothetical protein